MNITNLLDNIKIILKRKKNIEGIISISTLELYEFELKGYPNLLDEQKIQFSNLTDSPKDSCGFIDVDKKVEFNKDKISSCDPLLSPDQSGGDFVYNIQKFYQLYKKWRAKAKFSDTDRDYLNVDKSLRDNILILFKNIRAKQIVYIEKNQQELTIQKKDNEELHQGALVYKINLKNTEKVVIFGDFHGSYHTFLRHMFRLYRAGIIADLLKYTLVTGYRLVFLGDILDRGEYALEIILFICNLMYANNTEHELKVILNRGNHEELDQSTNDGFFDEIKKKFKFYYDDTSQKIYNTLKEAKNNSDEELSTIAKNFAIRNLTHETLKEAKNKSDEELKAEARDVAIDHYIKYSPNSIFKNFHEMINYMPSAIILQNESGQKFWLSHGGVPFNNKGEAIKFEILEKDNKAIEFVSDKNVASQIRWNDFDNITGLQFNSIRNIGNIIGPDKAKEFMKLNNIHFIIRGHQDNPDNSFLLSNVDRYILGGVNNLGNEKIVRNMSAKTNERDRNVIFGPIYRIDLTENWNDGITVFDMNKNEHQVYPVITLSTNTDLGRNLVHDSFGILRFDLPKEKLDDFSKETNIIDTRKDMKTISGFTTQSV